jgi:nucleoside-diphosphate-sugar epimerase
MTGLQGNLLVIGARSLIGRRMREAVADWPGEVRFTSRRPLSGQSLIFDLDDPARFDPGLDFSHVVMCSPIWLAHEAVLQRLVELGMKRLIAFSSTSRLTKGASPEPAEREVVERLAQGEATIVDFCPKHGVAYTILRPTLIYDEGQDENVSRIASLIRKLGFFPVCGPATGLRQPVHARELARAAVQALPAQAAFDQSYNLSGGEALTYRAMVERIFRGLGRKPLIVSLPLEVWGFALGVLDWLRPNKTLKRNINMAARMNVDLWFDHAPASHDFGYAPGPFAPGDFTPAS